MNTLIGKRLGNWIIEKELGQGGMGKVYLAHQESGSTPGTQQAAIKVMAGELSRETGFLNRFQREIEALSQLNHPHIVRFYEAGTQDGLYYYIMEYVSGQNFEELLMEKGRLPWKEVLDMALQIGPALKHAHDHGIIHRDIKPPNLMRTEEGIVKLTDFGVAKIFAGKQLTATGAFVGTADFLSPEQAAGKPVTKRSDLYSLGVVLYTLLTGRTPFQGKTVPELLHKHRYAQFDPPKRLVPDIPHDLDEVICQLMEKDPAHRPADSLVLQRQLDRIHRKLERKGNLTLESAPSASTRADQPVEEEEPENEPGPATLMSRMMRQELDSQNRGGPIAQFFNKPWVVVSLFMLCLGVLIWHFWPRPTPSAEALFEAGSALMQSDQPANWDKAWNDYFDPLNSKYPDHPYQHEVSQFRQRIDDHAAQRRALAGTSLTMSEAQRFYAQGLRLCQEGNPMAARQVWTNLVRSFGCVEAEQRWVRLAESALTRLDAREPAGDDRFGTVRQALQQARALRQEGQVKQAEEIWQAILELYQNDPGAREIVEEVRRGRGK